MKCQLCFLLILHLIRTSVSEVPHFPNMAQWKIPLYYGPKVFAPVTHQETKDFVQRLEYNVQDELQDASSVGLQILNLNDVMDDDFAIGIEKDVIDELDIIDKEAGDKVKPADLEMRPILQMHQGQYHPSPQYNLLIDGLIKHVKKIVKKREMDPLYFTVHKRGIVRHLPRKNGLNNKIPSNQTAVNSTNSPLGGGVISGLGKLKRFGNPESRKGENGTLVRSHFYFGPLDIDFVFGREKGLVAVNSTLSSLAAHVLFDVSNPSEIKIIEFLIDSPMDYEIRMKGARNVRFRSLSQAAITRLFKRSGRMEKRLQRSFVRAASRPLAKIMKGLKAGNNLKIKKTKLGNKITKKVTA